jgi:hypothetical protein
MYHMTSPRTAGASSMQLIKTSWRRVSAPSHCSVTFCACVSRWTAVLFLRLRSVCLCECSSSKRLNGFWLNLVFEACNKTSLEFRSASFRPVTGLQISCPDRSDTRGSSGLHLRISYLKSQSTEIRSSVFNILILISCVHHPLFQVFNPFDSSNAIFMWMLM